MEKTGSLLAHLGCPKSDPDLKIFLVLFDEKIYTVHKRTVSGSEIAFYYFFKFQTLVRSCQTYSSPTTHLGELVQSGKVNQFI